MVSTGTLNVSVATGLQELREFSGLNRDSSNIRGRKVDGTLQLYAAPAKTGAAAILSKLNPMAMHERRLAQKGLNRIFANHEKATGVRVSDALSRNARKPLTTDVKLGRLNVLSTIDAKQTIRSYVEGKFDGVTAGPSAATLGVDSAEIKSLIAKAGEMIKDQGDLFGISDPAEKVAKFRDVGAKLTDIKVQIGKAFLKNFEASNPTKEQRQDFTTSMGNDTVKALKAQLLPLAFPGKKLSDLRGQDEILTGLASSAFNYAASKCSSNQFKGEHEFNLDNVNYKKDPKASPLGEGGFGVVHDFSSAAVKIPHVAESAEQQVLNTGLSIQEISRHRRVEGNGHPNVLPMKGAVRMENGSFAIVLEKAKYGDLKSFSRDMKLALEAGVISPNDALLVQRLATRDMLRGLAHSHANGMMNQDVKYDNFLITEDATIKLADHGGAREIEGYDHDDQGAITKEYLSPEATDSSEIQADIDHTLGIDDATPSMTAAESARSPNDLAIEELIDRNFPKATPEAKATLAKDFKTATKQQVMESLPRKRDGFALGLAAGKLLYDHAGPKIEIDNIADYSKGLAQLRSLISDLSNPLFMNRTSPAEALKSPAVTLTSDEVSRGRSLIKTCGEWGLDFARNGR